MQPVNRQRRAAVGGFGLIEMMVVVVLVGLILAVGIPRMAEWSMANKAASASEFYAEAVHTARNEAVRHNAVTRLVLSSNAANGQMDWQVDLCYPTAATPCNNASGAWSSTDAAASNDPDSGAGFRSVRRSAAVLPSGDVLQESMTPSGATSVYFTAVGWVDTTVPARLTRIDLAPAAARAKAFPASAILITLAGNAVKCDPGVASGDSRACI
jgi:type IV fimbrial biogenesis protein FimT